MVFEALGEDGVDTFGGLTDERRVVGVRLRGLQGLPHHDHTLIDAPHQDDQDGEQRSDGEHDHKPANDAAPPQAALRRRQCLRLGHVSHGQPPSLVRPRLSPAVIASAWSMVMCSSLRAAVLRTDSVSESLIIVASSPIERASSRIGTTSATTTSTTTIVMT